MIFNETAETIDKSEVTAISVDVRNKSISFTLARGSESGGEFVESKLTGRYSMTYSDHMDYSSDPAGVLVSDYTVNFDALVNSLISKLGGLK